MAGAAGGVAAADVGEATPADAAPADAAAAPVPAATQNASAEIGQSVYDVTVGENATIELELSNTSNVTLQIGDETTDYAANLTVSDGDDDGMVTLQFDTSAAGVDGTTFAADGEDQVTVDNETTLEEQLGTADLPVSVIVEGNESDSAVMLLREEIRNGENETETGNETATDEGVTGEETTEPATTEEETDEGGVVDDTETPALEEDETDGTTPGFGPVAALVALLAAALLARR